MKALFERLRNEFAQALAVIVKDIRVYYLRRHDYVWLLDAIFYVLLVFSQASDGSR